VRDSTLKEWKESATSSSEKVDESAAHMAGARLYLLVGGLSLAMFLVALVRRCYRSSSMLYLR
jgi:hypothetical protein